MRYMKAVWLRRIYRALSSFNRMFMVDGVLNQTHNLYTKALAFVSLRAKQNYGWCFVLTINVQFPTVLGARIGYRCVLRTAWQILATIVNRWCKAQHGLRHITIGWNLPISMWFKPDLPRVCVCMKRETEKKTRKDWGLKTDLRVGWGGVKTIANIPNANKPYANVIENAREMINKCKCNFQVSNSLKW